MEVFSYLPLFRRCFGKQDGLGQANLDWIMISVFLIFPSCLTSRSDTNFYWNNLLWQVPPVWHKTSELLYTQCCILLYIFNSWVSNGQKWSWVLCQTIASLPEPQQALWTISYWCYKKRIQKFTCKWLNKACNRRTVPCSFSSRIRLGMLQAWELFRWLMKGQFWEKS